MGLNLVNHQIAADLELPPNDVQGHAEIVTQLGRAGCWQRLKGRCGRRPWPLKAPDLWDVIRDGQVVIAMLPDVHWATLEPLVQRTIQAGSRLYTDEYNLTTVWVNRATRTGP